MVRHIEIRTIYSKVELVSRIQANQTMAKYQIYITQYLHKK